MRRKERRTRVPALAFSKAGLMPASLELVVSKMSVGHLSPAEMRYQRPLKTHLPFTAFPREPGKNSHVLEERERFFLSKALALKNITK